MYCDHPYGKLTFGENQYRYGPRAGTPSCLWCQGCKTEIKPVRDVFHFNEERLAKYLYDTGKLSTPGLTAVEYKDQFGRVIAPGVIVAYPTAPGSMARFKAGVVEQVNGFKVTRDRSREDIAWSLASGRIDQPKLLHVRPMKSPSFGVWVPDQEARVSILHENAANAIVVG
jgi:hypothetical protein